MHLFLVSKKKPLYDDSGLRILFVVLDSEHGTPLSSLPLA